MAASITCGSTNAVIARHLYTNGLPELDLLIRTSGEMRLSNFLLWQAAYAEIFVTDTLWPDFRGSELLEAIEAFQKRERRFGGLIRRRTLLVKRVLTAVILIPLVIIALFKAPLWLLDAAGVRRSGAGST